jgi:hypothetical protein
MKEKKEKEEEEEKINTLMYQIFTRIESNMKHILTGLTDIMPEHIFCSVCQWVYKF